MQATSNSLLSTTGVQVPPQQRQLLSEMINCISEKPETKNYQQALCPTSHKVFHIHVFAFAIPQEAHI